MYLCMSQLNKPGCKCFLFYHNVSKDLDDVRFEKFVEESALSEFNSQSGISTLQMLLLLSIFDSLAQRALSIE